jgi:hypothetical protein
MNIFDKAWEIAKADLEEATMSPYLAEGKTPIKYMGDKGVAHLAGEKRDPIDLAHSKAKRMTESHMPLPSISENELNKPGVGRMTVERLAEVMDSMDNESLNELLANMGDDSDEEESKERFFFEDDDDYDLAELGFDMGDDDQ